MKIEYTCEVCGKKYTTAKQANECEKKHKKFKALYEFVQLGLFGYCIICDFLIILVMIYILYINKLSNNIIIS